MLKTIKLSKVLASKKFKVDNNEYFRIGSRVNETFKNLSKSKKLNDIKPKILIYVNIRVIEKQLILIFNVKKTFNYLKQVFITPII